MFRIGDRRVYLTTVVALMASVSASARAAPSEEVRVATRGDCPASETLFSSLSELLPDRRVAIAVDEATPNVTVADLGAAFRIEVGEQVRTIDDASRDCKERAVTAAVFAAFVVDPPTGPARVIRSTFVEPPRALHEDLAVGAMLAGTTKTSLATGGSLRLFVGNDWIGGVVGVTGLAPTTLGVGLAQARLVRVPIDLGLRVRSKQGQIHLAADLGFVIAPIFITGMEVGEPASVTELELGGRAAASVELTRWGRWAPFASLEAIVGSRHELFANDGSSTMSRETPAAWLSATIGIDMSFY